MQNENLRTSDSAENYIRRNRIRRVVPMREYLEPGQGREYWRIFYIGDFLRVNYSGRKLQSAAEEADKMQSGLDKWRARKTAILRSMRRSDEAAYVDNIDIPLVARTVDAAFDFYQDKMESMDTDVAMEYMDHLEYWRDLQEITDLAVRRLGQKPERTFGEGDAVDTADNILKHLNHNS